MPSFELGGNVAKNVQALRRALGSAVRELSRADLAKLIAAEHPQARQLNATTIGRWESGESEPDLHSVLVMAKLAGVTFEQFAFGSGESVDVDPARDRKLTDEELARAERAAKATQSARAVKKGARRRPA